MRERPPTDPILGIIPADPSLRRVALVAWLLLGAIGATAVWYVSSVVDDARALAQYDARGAFLEIQRIAIPMIIGTTLVGVGAAAYFLLTAVRVMRSGRFPPPGARVVRATPIRSGPAAQRLGVVLTVIALIILAASVATPLFLRRVVAAVEEQAKGRMRAVPPDSAL
jgi:hypothetical protein